MWQNEMKMGRNGSQLCKNTRRPAAIEHGLEQSTMNGETNSFVREMKDDIHIRHGTSH